jgi:hypothetical protein
LAFSCIGKKNPPSYLGGCLIILFIIFIHFLPYRLLKSQLKGLSVKENIPSRYLLVKALFKKGAPGFGEGISADKP